MSAEQVRTPQAVTLTHAATLGMTQDKPVMFDYYTPSLNKQCRLVKTQDNDTILYKNEGEYTSPLRKVFQVDASVDDQNTKDIICISENSVYIVHSNILQTDAGA